MFEYLNPEWFWALFIILPILAYELLYKRKHRLRFIHSRGDILRKVAGSSKYLIYWSLLLRIIIIVLLIVTLARPRIANKQQQITGKGIDIMLVIDVSGSMKAVDFQPVNRLEAAKKVAEDFIQNRFNDRIGMVIFSENAYTQCPLTLDYNILMNIMEQVVINEQAKGTAIGMGLATAVARLKDSQAQSKVIILITDGRNNAGEIDPLMAAELAETYQIKVYPIGVGQKGEVDYPVQTAFGIRYQKTRIEVDMETLNQIADLTGTGKARRAQNTEELKSIISLIDKMEKTELKIEDYYTYQELFWYYLIAALILLLIEISFKTIFKQELPT